MTIYFVSSADGDDGDSGLTLDLAWATLDFALENGALSTGDAVDVRRTHSEILASSISPVDDGNAANPIKIFGCPRAAHAISSSDWVNGSTSVTVDDADMDREKHQARYITAPDGNIYFITRVVDASTITIDREYAGSTSPNDATASIEADSTQTDWDDYDDSADTIKKSAWEADVDDLPVIDFNDGNFQLVFSGDNYFHLYCLELKDSGSGTGIIRMTSSRNMYLEGLLLKQSAANFPVINLDKAGTKIRRSTLEGSGSGVAQIGMRYQNASTTDLLDVAIYNCGNYGIEARHTVIKMQNVNIGVEIANGSDDIKVHETSDIQGVDVKLGGSNGFVSEGNVSIENYQKVLGEHRTFYRGGYFEKVAVSGETPNKKVSDYVMKVIPNVNYLPVFEYASTLLVHEVDEVTTGSKTFKYWLYNDTGDTLNSGDALGDIWLKAEYVDSFDDTTEYTQLDVFSTETNILDAADVDDWDFLEVTLNPATTSKVRLTIFISYYNAATNLFIDPAVVIS